jgi:hypothetical protein
VDETTSGQLNVRRLASLVRIYGMLCACAASVEERTENALLARHYAQRMWQTSMAEVNRIDSEDAHKAALAAAPLAAVVPAPAAAAAKSSSSSSKDKDKVDTPPPAPLLNRYPLPQTDEEWAAFHLSDALVALLRRGRQCTTLLAPNTLPNAAVFYHELGAVAAALAEDGRGLATLPLLVLAETVAHCALQVCVGGWIYGGGGGGHISKNNFSIFLRIIFRASFCGL